MYAALRVQVVHVLVYRQIPIREKITKIENVVQKYFLNNIKFYSTFYITCRFQEGIFDFNSSTALSTLEMLLTISSLSPFNLLSFVDNVVISSFKSPNSEFRSESCSSICYMKYKHELIADYKPVKLNKILVK